MVKKNHKLLRASKTLAMAMLCLYVSVSLFPTEGFGFRSETKLIGPKKPKGLVKPKPLVRPKPLVKPKGLVMPK